MKRCLKRKSSRRGTSLTRGLRTVIGLPILMSATSVLVAQDDYLKALESEATKIDAEPERSESVTGAGDVAVASAADSTPGSGVTREQFESLMQDKYRGTYVFYRQLQPHTQEEIFSEFEKGVPIAELRDKVVERYLQR